MNDDDITSTENAVRLKSDLVIKLPCPIPGKARHLISGTPFTVHIKYKILKPIGVGAYGVVAAAIDMETGRKVAIKKISGVFDNFTDAKRIIREVRLMRALNHENVSYKVDMNRSVWFLFRLY